MKRSRNMVKSDANSEKPSASNETGGNNQANRQTAVTTTAASKPQNIQIAPKPLAPKPLPASSLQKTAVMTKPIAATPNSRPTQQRPQQRILQQPQQQLQPPQPQQHQLTPRLAVPMSSTANANSVSVSTIRNTVSSLLAKPGYNRLSLSPRQPMEVPKSSPCGACGSTVPVSAKIMRQHPKLNIVVCDNCFQFYHSGKWKRDADGHFIHCQCCADGGSMVCCSRCDQVACRSCLKRILGRKELTAALDKDWLCLVCHPHQMSAFLNASLRALSALKLKTSADKRLSFPPHPASNHVVNGAASTSSASSSGAFKQPATINAFFPARNQMNAPNSASNSATGNNNNRTNQLISATKNLADDFGGVFVQRQKQQQQRKLQQQDDDDVVIIDTTVSVPKASAPRPVFPQGTGLNVNRANGNIAIGNNLNNNNNYVSNVPNRKTLEQGVSYLDQRLKNWRSLLDKMVRNHSINGASGPVKGKMPLSPRSLKPERSAHSLKQDFAAMISKMKKEIESLERNLLAPTPVNVINVSGAFKPAAAHQVQRGSPDLHGCWMLPQEIKVAPKAKSQRTLDQEESEDDSEEEEEKAVIRIGSSFQAIIPEKIDPGAKKPKCESERADGMLLWHPYGLPENKTEEFLEKAAISSKGDLQLHSSSFLRDNEKALYLLMKSKFDADLALKSLERHQKRPAPEEDDQTEKQEQTNQTKRQRLSVQTTTTSADDPTETDTNDDKNSVQNPNATSKLTSSFESAPSSSSGSASPGGQSLITKFLSRQPAGEASSSVSRSSTSSSANKTPDSDGPLGVVGRKSIHENSESTIPLDAEKAAAGSSTSADASSSASPCPSSGLKPSPSTRSSVSSPHKYTASLDIINGVVETREPMEPDSDDEVVENAADATATSGSKSTPPMVETAQVRRWTEAECYAFECGLRAHGKEFNDIRKHRLPGRSVAEIVQFYYLWKKTERRNFIDFSSS